MPVVLIGVLLTAPILVWVATAAQRLRWQGQVARFGLKRGVVGQEGTYRGRLFVVEQQADGLVITARVANPARLFDSFGAGDPLPRAPWLSELALAHLGTLLTDAAPKEPWRVLLVGPALRLTVRGTLARRPERLAFLMELASDLAEGIDRMGAA